MPIIVNTNTQSLFAQRALGNNTVSLQKSIEKLSTGFRINRAGDDAAGLSISEKLTSQIRGLEKAKQNAGDGISLVQTAEGALSVIQDNLQRIRELVVQGKNGTNGSSEADALQREINERVSTIDAIAKSTKFNGIDLIYDNDASSSGDNITLQTGSDNSQTLTINFSSEGTAHTGIDIDIAEAEGSSDDEGHIIEGVAASGLALNKIHLGVSGMATSSVSGTNITITLDDMDTIINNVSRMRSYLGAVQNSLESRIDYLDVAVENSSASRSRVKDVDVAYESSVMLRNQILQQSAASMLTQANATPQLALNLLP